MATTHVPLFGTFIITQKTQEFSKSSCVFLQKEIEWKTEKKTFTFAWLHFDAYPKMNGGCRRWRYWTR